MAGIFSNSADYRGNNLRQRRGIPRATGDALSLPREGEKQEERFFTAVQVRQIINASEEPYSTLWAVLSLTGCRAGEALALKRGDLDFDKRVIRIRRTLDHAEEHTSELQSHLNLVCRLLL